VDLRIVPDQSFQRDVRHHARVGPLARRRGSLELGIQVSGYEAKFCVSLDLSVHSIICQALQSSVKEQLSKSLSPLVRSDDEETDEAVRLVSITP
jgi:hypothetical protein